MTRLKFYLTVKKKVEEMINVVFYPVTDGSKENEEFWKYTPIGALEFTTSNQEAAKQFEVGKEYYIDIKEVEVKTD